MPPLSVVDELMCKEEVLVRTAEYNELAKRTFTTRHGIKRQPQGKTEICCRSTAFYRRRLWLSTDVPTQNSGVSVPAVCVCVLVCVWVVSYFQGFNKRTRQKQNEWTW